MEVPMRSVALPTVLALLALGSCASDDRADSYAGSYYDPGAQPVPTARAGPGASAASDRVTIPPAVVAELDGFLAQGATLMGDRVELDVSQVYFLASTGFTVSKDAVERTETRDPARGLTTVRLTATQGYQTVYETMPKVYFGEGGLQVLAVRELVVRYWTGSGVERPIWFRAVASGNAVLLEDGAPPVRREGDVLQLSASVERDAARGYRFTQALEGAR
jgi:hypothetical protein